MATEIALGVVMVISLVVLCAMGDAEILAPPPLVVAVFFVIPLCQAFLRAVACGREAMTTGDGSPWATFRRVLWPRGRLWLALWAAYFIVLEVYMGLVLGGGSLMTSASCGGLVLGMVASCFIWAPRCRKLWTLALLTVSTALPGFILFCILGGAIVTSVGLGGYMGLGAVVYAPLVASVFLLLGAICVWRWARRRGDAWFRV